MLKLRYSCPVVHNPLTHTGPVARPRQTPTPGAEAAYKRIVATQVKLAKLDDQRDALIAERAQDVTEALGGGMSLREIAARLGMSPERIRQMGLVKATPKKEKQ